MTADDFIATLTAHPVGKDAEFAYVNWRGEAGLRRVCLLAPPLAHLMHRATERHPGEQWVYNAWDRDRGAVRTFAVKDITGWKAIDREKR